MPHKEKRPVRQGKLEREKNWQEDKGAWAPEEPHAVGDEGSGQNVGNGCVTLELKVG